MTFDLLTDSCRRALEASVDRLRGRPMTAASRAHQIQAQALLRTLAQWQTRRPYPEQPPRLARLVYEIASEVLGPTDALVLALPPPGPSSDPDEPRETQAGRRGVDGRYVRVREIARSAHGEVLEARDTILERTVAMKVVALPGVVTEATFAPLRREAAALAAVRSDHVAQVFAFGPHGRGYFLAMELVRGRDLRSILDEQVQHGSRLAVPLAVAILGRVASGLGALHDAGLHHGDVNPGNVLIEEETGRAVLVGARLHPSPVGARPRAPGDPASSAEDVHALACVAFEMLAGRAPFTRARLDPVLARRRTGPPPAPSSVRPGLGPFDAVLLRALAADPAERHSTAGELAGDLDAALMAWLTPGPTAPAIPAVAAPVVVARTEGYPDGARVLIVDDDPVFVRLATRCVELAFTECPVTIEASSSSHAAIDAAGRAMPELLVLDFGLPGEDGITTLTRLRQMPHGDRPRVIVVSASVSEVEEWRFRALGVSDFVSKPIRLQAFVDRIAETAARAGWQSAHGAS